MNRQCEHCGNPLAGRSDKRFCSINCKNAANMARRKATLSVVRQTDRYLHRNREILNTLMGPSRTKMKIARTELDATGFRYNYLTGIYFNKEGKIYHNVYDFAWMEFSTQEILIVRRKRN